MKTNKNILLPVLFIAVMLYSCSPKNISTKYYYQNEKVLDSIEESYKEINSSTPFDVGFTSKDFKIVSLGILTDSLKYIYEFKVGEDRLADTLKKFGLPVKPVIELVMQMQSIRCTWISSYDYYTDEKKQELIFMSIKPVALNAPLSYKKYYILTYFQQPQYFDNNGLLLERRKLKRLRKINGEIFKRINDKVCYTVSTTYR
ncbi:MAG: hypothetical protein R2765_12970 [Ferruginibacter sp.]|nr:hypothetical protein [Bacteroidota bacterium]MBX2918711.1 hypothetical protein [Ferruginibacter sp.]MCB0708517.1 hypothetical protein [Chitinophagaceae bacterium]MCC7378163.1 hypothetical protein [Chitinophagaceae bacterium]